MSRPSRPRVLPLATHRLAAPLLIATDAIHGHGHGHGMDVEA